MGFAPPSCFGWSAAIFQQRDALDVVGHREHVEGPEPAEQVAVLGEDRDVPRQCGRVARDVRHRARRAGRRPARRRPASHRSAAGRAPRGRPARRRPRPAPRPTSPVSTSAPGTLTARVPARVGVALDQGDRPGRARRRRPGSGRTDRPRRRGRAPTPPAAATSIPSTVVDQHLGRARVDLPEAGLRGDLEGHARARGRTVPRRRSGSRRPGRRRGSGACASRAGRPAAGRSAGGSASAARPGRRARAPPSRRGRARRAGRAARGPPRP